MKQKERQRGALSRLEAQLESGVKNTKVDGKDVTIELSKEDTKRIKSEITNLKKKVS